MAAEMPEQPGRHPAPVHRAGGGGTRARAGHGADLRRGRGCREGWRWPALATALEALRQPGQAVDAPAIPAGGAGEGGGLRGDLRAEVVQMLSMLYLRRLKFYDAVLACSRPGGGRENPTHASGSKERSLSFSLMSRNTASDPPAVIADRQQISRLLSIRANFHRPGQRAAGLAG